MSEQFKMYGSVEQLESLNEELGTKVGLNIVSDLKEIEELKKNLTK